MLKNYLTLAMRRLKRQPGYTFINVAGLAVGMACCVLIGLYVKDELSFDRFHERADRLYTFAHHGAFWGPSLSTPYPLAPTMESGLPDVEHAARTWGGTETAIVREEGQIRSDEVVMLTEPSFFRMFSFATVAGDPVAALGAPDGVVLTAATARAFFGDENPIGRTLQIPRFGNERIFTVGGVVGDVPANSTIRFDVAAPLPLIGEEYMRDDSWSSFMYRTYVLTSPPLDADVLNEKLAGALTQHFRDAQRENDPPTFKAYPLKSVYLSNLYGGADGFKGQYRYLYIFGSVAFFVLLIAAVNYVNLATVQATQRAREVGMRKALGARYGQLVRQFLGESMLLSFAALAASLLLTAAALPAFNRLFEKDLVLGSAEIAFALILLFAFVVLVAVAAGAYPAFVLSHFRPTAVLRGAGTTVTSSSGGLLRKGLVVFQFTISVALIIGTAVIYEQLKYVQNKDLGFEGEQVVVVNLPGSLSDPVRESLKQQALSAAGVRRASVANGLPSQFNMTLGRPVGYISPEARTEKESVQFKPAVVDFDFVETLGLSVLAGRSFSEDFSADLTRAYVLNEAAARELGWSSEEAVGKSFKLSGSQETPEGEVIGVVEDFHIASLHQEIEPIVLQLREDDSWSTSYVLIVKLAPDGIRGAVEHIEQQFARAAPGETFQYEFLDDRFDAMYRTEQRLSRIFTTFAALAILIACLGLFGLAAFTAQRRTKEIGIRKVLGASVAGIMALLSKDFLTLVGIAFVVAAPVAYFGMNRWLEDFAYRIEIGPGVFLLVGALAFIIAVATVSYQSMKAALADPAKSLRYE